MGGFNLLDILQPGLQDHFYQRWEKGALARKRRNPQKERNTMDGATIRRDINHTNRDVGHMTGKSPPGRHPHPNVVLGKGGSEQ